jgi:hypothetical protein
VFQQSTKLEDLTLSVRSLTGTQGRHPTLFALLEQLPHLTQLQLSGEFYPPVGSDPAACAAAATLTTSNRLQHLKLHLGLPEAAWGTLFPAKDRQAGLTSLDIASWHWVSNRFVCSPGSFPGFESLTALQSLRLQFCVL